jgi:hypothetical protein
LKILFILIYFIPLTVSAKYSLAAEVIEVLLKSIEYVGKNSSSNYVEKLNKNRNEDLESKVKITYDFDYIQRCKRLSKIQGSIIRNKERVISTPFECEVDYGPLINGVIKIGGDTLFINSFTNRCDIQTYISYAYLCE